MFNLKAKHSVQRLASSVLQRPQGCWQTPIWQDGHLACLPRTPRTQTCGWHPLVQPQSDKFQVWRVHDKVGFLIPCLGACVLQIKPLKSKHLNICLSLDLCTGTRSMRKKSSKPWKPLTSFTKQEHPKLATQCSTMSPAGKTQKYKLQLELNCDRKWQVWCKILDIGPNFQHSHWHSAERVWLFNRPAKGNHSLVLA